MSARRKTVLLDMPSTWSEYRRQRGLPESLQLRERGKCYDCGNPLEPGKCGGWHSRMEGGTRGYGHQVEFCCNCRGCDGKAHGKA